MEITPDSRVLWETVLWPGFEFRLNATIFFTWIVMAVLVMGAAFVVRRVSVDAPASRWRTAVEVIVRMINDQIFEISHQDPKRFLPFIGTLFLFVAVSNLLLVVPGFTPPTASLSTTTALAICVLVAVPIFGVSRMGVRGYLRAYLKPTILMLPFNIIGEITRAIALAVRLYGNIMSGVMIAAILLGVAPFFFPVVMDLLGLLIGLIQAYIFSVLAMVYIAAAVGPPITADAPPGAETKIGANSPNSKES